MKAIATHLVHGLVLSILALNLALAQESEPVKNWKLNYGSKGFEIKSTDGNYKLQFQSRFQFRFAYPYDSDPVAIEDFNADSNPVFKLNRARLKVGGNAYKPWLKFYWEYDLGKSYLLDYRVMVEPWEGLKLKVGQWKVEYSRERHISSGDQQLMDRSIINQAFTVDRQQGVEIYGRLRDHGAVDFNYWLAALTGTGRGNTANDDRHLMYFGRVQWNLLGEDIGFESSDLDFRQKPAAIIAVAGVTNRSPYTRFSSSGGGSLEGFDEEENGQYRVKQVNFETAFAYNGFAWQSEYHLKDITDKRNNDASTSLRGFYVQAGYLAAAALDWWPEPLEIAARYARYTPDTDLDHTFESEKSLAFNWFFREHKNKLTMEFSQFRYELANNASGDEFRFRLQWDISF
ncbi:porin [Mangrovibacterium diazotrophicum]|uniref:Phosphate-selective porin n=1 Tax=Mangrovibacterium diazotrophicum TaxID=1261403 RepID=A0A419W3D7_9BACT|nr:porin [Mangrovibacterium diazotrophicum]RKD90001.1 phosphate-selective porin [Mangrovibacterium diazotrophicum]